MKWWLQYPGARRARGAGATGTLAVAMLTFGLARCTPAPEPEVPQPPPPPPAVEPVEREVGEVIVPPEPAREFRGVWVAAVSNIDWPSRPGLPVDSQKAELVRMFDRAQELRLNAVILHVRPAGDALYASELEPWSYYLTGEQGKAPEPFYDPLAFAVEEAHERGLELHAWFNPYRAKHPSARGPLAPTHLARTRPDLVKEYGTHLWMDPGEDEVREHTLKVILDVVRRYDVDGVHIDDYFYPYREKDRRGREIAFPDDRSYARYRAAGGTLERGDWRRHNVDRLIEEMYRAVKAEKPWVQVGISPFGLWRPGHPPEVTGFDPYVQIYADSRKWLREGWVDYFTPQLYYRMDQRGQWYPVVLKWWTEQNVHGRHIWPGNFTSRVGGGSSSWPAGEILQQIEATRTQEGAGGNIHFSMRVLMRNAEGIADLLRQGPYAEPALVPATPWLGDEAPGQPVVSLATGAESRDIVLRIEPAAGVAPWLWVIQSRRDGDWRTEIVPARERTVRLEAGADRPDVIAISAVSRTGIKGKPVLVRLKPAA